MPRRGVGRIFKRRRKVDGKIVEGSTYWIGYRVDGKAQEESAGSDKRKDAEDLLRRRIREIDSGRQIAPNTRRLKVETLLDLRLQHYADNWPKSLAWAGFIDGHLRPFFGHLNAMRVGTSQIQVYIRRRKAEGVGNSTVNREIAQLHRAFTLGAEHDPPLVTHVPRIKLLPEPPPRKGFFEFAEFTELRRELPEPIRPIITFAYNTGCRLGEILWLKWTQVDLDVREIRLHPDETKNEEPRILPLKGELLEMVRMLDDKRRHLYPDCRWVFTRDGEKRIKDIRGAWEDASKRAAKRVPSLWNEEEQRPAKLFHDLRRTGVRNLVRAGVPERVAMLISGHKTRSVFERYNIVSTQDLHDAMAKLELYHEEQQAALLEKRSQQGSQQPKESVN
jgi:integrase